MDRFWLVLIFLHSALNGLSAYPQPSPTITFSNPGVEYRFDQDIVFTIEVNPLEQVRELYLVVQVPNAAPLLRKVPISSELVSYQLGLNGLYMPAFSHPVYSFQALTAAGSTIQSNPYTFAYIDNRFAWKTLLQSNFRLHWYAEQPDLQQNLLRITQAGIDSALKAFPGKLAKPFDLYLYPDAQSLRQALHLTLNSTVIAHAVMGSDVILVSDTADPLVKISRLEQQVPHEIAHLLQYQTLGSEAVANLPLWLSEGSASLAETYPDPDDAALLQNAVATHSLIPISYLCLSFPGGDKTRLAYAESASFVRFLQETYGQTAFINLLSAYKNGLTCQKGIETALGLPLDEVEETWHRDSLNSPSAPFILENISPYLLAGLLFMLIPLLSVLWVQPSQYLKTEP
jgi:hypothetical protein